MAKKKPQKSQEQVDTEKEQRFYAAMNRISLGQSRKSAILAEKMDPRTFNKIVRTKEIGGNALLTKIDKKGHYEIGHAPGSVSEWRVLDTDNHVRRIYVDKTYSAVLGRYWNAIDNYVITVNPRYLTDFKPTTIYTVDGVRIKLQLSPQEVKLWWSKLSLEQRDDISDTIYTKESSYAA